MPARRSHGYASPPGPAQRTGVRRRHGGVAIERSRARTAGGHRQRPPGAERPGLLGELVGGVSEQSYRVVFGFGLDELAIDRARRNADIVARLYAAGLGLAVNPMDARRRLEAAPWSIAPRAQKPVVNALAARSL